MGDTALWLLIGICDIALIRWLIHGSKLRKQHRHNAYYHDMCDSIHELDNKASQLEELDRMIQDLESCSNNLMKSIRIELPDSLSNMKSGTAFLVNGKDQNSKYLLSIAYSEREKLRSSLCSDLENILRSGVRETVRETRANSTEYDRGVPERGVQNGRI